MQLSATAQFSRNDRGYRCLRSVFRPCINTPRQVVLSSFCCTSTPQTEKKCHEKLLISQIRQRGPISHEFKKR